MFFDSDDFYLRPGISSMGTYNYNLAKYLAEFLDPVISKEHCAKDSFTFCEEMQQVSSNDNVFFENNPHLNVTKRELKPFFNFATSGTHVIFNGSFYDQIDGVSMGSP